MGTVVYARFGDRISKIMAKKRGKEEMKPEYRLPFGVVGSLCVPIGFLWYDWSVQADAHWIVPIIGTAFCRLGNCLIFVCIRLRSLSVSCSWNLHSHLFEDLNLLLR